MSDTEHKLGPPVPDWQGAAAPDRTIMQGRTCRLEPTSLEAHAADLFDVFQRGDEAWDWLYLPFGPFDTRPAFETWMKAFCLGDDPLFFTIIDLRTDKAVGIAGYLNIHPRQGTIEVGGIHFSPQIQRSRIATESMYLMMARAFEMGYRRYEWKCNSLNQRSRNAAMRFGFSYEGIFRNHMVAKGCSRDSAWYAMIDSEWPALKAAYETWLDPANFDGDGTQRQSLSSLTAPVLVARG